MPDEMLKDLEGIYKREQRYQLRAINKANQEVNSYVEGLAKRAVSETQKKEITDAGGDSSVNTPSVREST